MKPRAHGRFAALVLLAAFCAPIDAQTLAYFPYVVNGSGISTGLALSNPSANRASLTLTFLDGAGNPVGAPARLSLEPGGQIARLSTELFPGTVNTTGWVRVSSSESGIVGFYLNGDFIRTEDGGELPAPSRTLVYPWAVQQGTTSTLIVLGNPNTAPVTATFSLYAADGSPMQSRAVSLVGNGQIAQSVRSLMGIDTLDYGYVRVTAEAPVVGMQLVTDGNSDIAVLNARPEAPARTVYFPHIASGGGYTTTLFLMNSGSSARSVEFRFFNEDGTEGAAVRRTDLGPGQIYRQTVQQIFGFSGAALRTGWVRASSDAEILEGFQVFFAAERRGITALPVAKTPAARLIQSHVAEQTSVAFSGANQFTGLALLNPSNAAATAAVSIVTVDGRLLSETSVALRAFEKRALLLRELMPEALGETSGAVWVRSDAPVIALQVFGTWDLSLLSQIPAQAVPVGLLMAQPVATTYSISGRVTAPADVEPGGITVAAAGPSNASATTDYNGNFVVKGLTAGAYVLTPSKTGLSFSPANPTVSLVANSRGLSIVASRAGGTNPPPQPPPAQPPPPQPPPQPPPPTTLSVSPATVDVRVTSNVGVGGYQVTLRFDPSKVSLAESGVTGGEAPFSDRPVTVNIDNVEGTVILNSFQVGASPRGTLTVARLRFTGRAAGVSSLTVSSSLVVDVRGDSVQGATISVSASSLTVQ